MGLVASPPGRSTLAWFQGQAIEDGADLMLGISLLGANGGDARAGPAGRIRLLPVAGMIPFRRSMCGSPAIRIIRFGS